MVLPGQFDRDRVHDVGEEQSAVDLISTISNLQQRAQKCMISLGN